MTVITSTVELTRERRIAADPTSLALLLAGPTGVDLWPGASRRPEASGRLVVDATLAPFAEPVRLVIRAAAPRRTPAAFMLTFGWEPESELPDAVVAGGSATLALGYETPHETRASLRISLAGSADDARAQAVAAMASGFLDNLAAAAEARARAA